MSLNIYERLNTIRVDIDYKMSNVLTDPSGNKAFVTVIKPDGTNLITNETSTRDSVGEYHHFFRAGATDPLGIYVVIWSGYHNLGGSYGYMELVQRDAIQMVDVSQD